MTPAEKLAKAKRRKRPQRNAPAESEVAIWACHVRDVRESLNLSMGDVAKACGLSVSAYFRIEHGYADPCLTSAKRISEFFGRDVWSLWSERL